MQIIPGIELQKGRSRLVYWPGAATGEGTPTDRPERISARFVEFGAVSIHLVDLDGAVAGVPVNLEAVSRVAARVAVPLQIAGGLEEPDGIRLAFAAGATRVVLATSVADRPELLGDCLAVAGDWLAVGLDPRPERLAAFPWRRVRVPSLEELVAELIVAGVRRFVLTHGGAEPDLDAVTRLTSGYAAEFTLAGGVTDAAGIRRLRGAGLAGLILGQPLLSGAVSWDEAVSAAAD